MRTMENENREYILRVYGALQEKGYNAVGQIVGYLLTEDPTYITNHLDARRLIRKIDRYGLLADIVANYFDDTEEHVDGERPRGNISLSGAMQASDLFKEQKMRIPGSSLIGKTPVS